VIAVVLGGGLNLPRRRLRRLAVAPAAAVIGALLAATPALATGGSVSLSHVAEQRASLQPTLSFELSGVAPAGDHLVSIYLDRGCAPSASGEDHQKPFRRIAVYVQGGFQKPETITDIPRELWSGHMCAYLESGTGATVARAERSYRIATYQNPVYSGEFPDPMALDVDNAHRNYYAYGTGQSFFPILHSTDLVKWQRVATAFSRRPGWVVRSGKWNAWAPTVLEDHHSCSGAAPGRCFILYYVGNSAAFGMNCIGVATASKPAGPFTDHGILREAGGMSGESSGRPIGCGDAAGYTDIDPDPFVDDDGKAYLYVSTGASCVSGHCQWRPTISVLPLSRDRRHAAGPRIPLFSGDPGTWEQAPWAPVVEAPWTVRRGRTYVLFYSGGAWSGRYGMGYASASSPVGPFTKARENPLLADSVAVRSAGGGSLVTGPAGGSWVIYHGRSGAYDRPRLMRIERVRWAGDRPSIVGPTVTPQAPVP